MRWGERPRSTNPDSWRGFLGERLSLGGDDGAERLVEVDAMNKTIRITTQLCAPRDVTFSLTTFCTPAVYLQYNVHVSVNGANPK